MSGPVVQTFATLLEGAAQAAPERLAWRFFDELGRPTETLALGQLLWTSQRIAGLITAACGPTAAEAPVVMLCAGPGAEHIRGLLGGWTAGAVMVPVYPPTPRNPALMDTLVGVARASGASLLLTTPELAARLSGPLTEALGEAAPRLLVLPEPVTQAPTLAEEAGPTWARPDEALILYTSGSTGSPKGAVITHSGFVGNMRALVERARPGGAQRVCVWLPQSHIAGLYTRLLPLVTGGEVAVLPPEAFARRPATWLELMSTLSCTYTIAPDFAYALCAATIDEQTVAGLDLRAWRMLVAGGERIRPSTMDAFFGRFARTGVQPDALFPYYGMTESLCNAIPQGTAPLRLQASKRGLFFGRLRVPEDPDDTLELYGHGPPLGDGTEIAVVHPEGRWPMPPGQVGELWTRGPAIIPRYHRDPETTAAALSARLDSGDGPWLRTGDLGMVHEGQIFVTGRLKELLIVRGKNHYPQDLEATALKATGLPAGAAAAFTVIHDGDEALGLALEVPLELAADAARVEQLVRKARREVARNHGLMIAELYLVPPGTLPLTTTNKIAREECRQRAASGAWADFKAAIARQRSAARLRPELAGLRGAPLHDAVLTGLRQILAEGEGGALSERELDLAFSDLGISSLEVARVAMDLRRLTGVEVPFSMLFQSLSVRALAEQLCTLIEQGDRPADSVKTWRREVRSLACALPNRMPPRRAPGGPILMTGATGYLGSYLLASLLRGGAEDVRCLVRAADAKAGLARVEAALRGGPGWDEAWRTKLSAVPGDLAKPRLGLDAETWARQVAEVGVIVHNAANVNFVSPYSVLRHTNVSPVHPLVELAISGGSCKTVHYVGTLAVFNATFRREQRLVHSFDRLLKPDFLYSGYAQTKWVAEACFRVAGSRGIPMGIHRPGLITGASDTGHTNVDDFLCRLVLGCIALGAYPDVEVELDLVGVDDVAEGIALSVLSPTGQGELYIETFHWSHPKPVLVSELMSVYQERGYAMRPIPLQEWLGLLRAGLPTSNPLFPVHPFLLEIPEGSDETILEFMDGLPHTIDRSDADALRAASGVTQKVIDREAMHHMAGWLERHGHLTPPRNPIARTP